MKKISLVMLSLAVTLSVTAISTSVYADNSNATGSTCQSCGCRPHAEDPENIVPREGINSDVPDQQGDVKTQY